MTDTFNYTPHKKQHLFHYTVSQKKVTLFNSGRGVGKTMAGLVQSLYYALNYVTSGIIVAPTYDMLMDNILPMMYDMLPAYVMEGYHKQSKKLYLPNGSLITLRSGENPNRLRGGNRDWAWLDEARNYDTDEVYKVVLAQLRNKRLDKMWITTTPAGLFHWLYKSLAEQSQTDPNIGFVSASTKDNPYLSDEYYTFLKTQYTGLFADQELEGKFVSFEGLVYDTFSLAENVAPVERNPNNPLYIGIDDGYSYGGGEGTASYHPRVITFIERQPNGGFYVLDEYVATNELAEVSLANAFTMYPKESIYGAYIDSSASDLIRRVGDLGISYLRATHRVSDGIKVLRRFILDGNGERLLKINPRCKHLIREFQTYRYSDSVKSEAGELAPIKQDDHSLDSLRYCVYSLGKW